MEKSNLTNCPNCGAVITGKKCEYCETIFEFIEEGSNYSSNIKTATQPIKFGLSFEEVVEAFDRFNETMRG